MDGIEEAVVVDLKVGCILDKLSLDLPVSALASRVDHLGSHRLVSEEVLDHLEVSVLDRVGNLTLPDLVVEFLDDAVEDLKASLLDRTAQ